MKLNHAGLQDRAAWEAAGITLPTFEHAALCRATAKAPVWVHFGSGSLFRAFHAMLQQSLLEQGLSQVGIYAAETFDYALVERSYTPYDDLTLMVSLMPDGTMEKTVVGSVAGALRADPDYPQDWQQLQQLFCAPSLQLITFTITEKGYALTGLDGQPLPQAQHDLTGGPAHPCTAMGKVTALLLARFQSCRKPLAVVSTDNCSHNGEKLRGSILAMARQWLDYGLAPQEFYDWLSDETQVSFPWTMIDKITPRPAPAVEEALTALGLEEMQISVTDKGSYAAPFVNAEKPQYLVIEDRFPNGRPPLERAGVYMADRDTVNRMEKMKVTTCLNPLHTALAVYGCLLGYTSIAAEMADPQLNALVHRIGYDEGIPVVVDPKILDPLDFLHEVVDQRLPNPFIPDTPQRIACDTSQKVGIRFGETIRSYAARPELDVTGLTFIPLAIAGWLRYLLALDDTGAPMACSGDPMLEPLQRQLRGIRFGDPSSLQGQLTPILSNEVLFGSDLVALGLSPTIEGMFRELLDGPGAVRRTLQKYLKN